MAESDAEATVRFAVADAIISNIHHTNLGGSEVEFLVGVIVDRMFDYSVRWAAKAYADELDLRRAKVGHQQQRD